jgi:hypothetical protein
MTTEGMTGLFEPTLTIAANLFGALLDRALAEARAGVQQLAGVALLLALFGSLGARRRGAGAGAPVGRRRDHGDDENRTGDHRPPKHSDTISQDYGTRPRSVTLTWLRVSKAS